METTELFLLGGIAILAVIMCIYYSKCRHCFAKLLFGAASGALLLFPAHWLVGALGQALSVNVFTLSVSAVLGAPGVLLLAVAAFL